MSNEKPNYKITFYAFAAMLAILLATAVWNRCEAQITIPLMNGTVERGDVYPMHPEGGVTTGDPFDLTQSYISASTTDLLIQFKRRKNEKLKLLRYPIDSIDVSDSMQDGYQSFTLWPYYNGKQYTAEKIEIFTNDVVYRLYIYFEDEIFFFTGKVL